MVTHTVPTAINVGDYLVGLGYRLAASTREEFGTACSTDIVAHLSEAHLRRNRPALLRAIQEARERYAALRGS